jgi:4-carboxymuconolactone decarboxylase
VLPMKTRAFMNLAMISALNRPHELEIHLRAALRNGMTKEEIKETFLHVATYCGAPAAMDGFRLAKRIFAEKAP